MADKTENILTIVGELGEKVRIEELLEVKNI